MQDDQGISFTAFDKLVEYGSLPKDKLLVLVRCQAQTLELVRVNAQSAKDGFLRPTIMDALDDFWKKEKSLRSAL